MISFAERKGIDQVCFQTGIRRLLGHDVQCRLDRPKTYLVVRDSNACCVRKAAPASPSCVCDRGRESRPWPSSFKSLISAKRVILKILRTINYTLRFYF